MAETVTCLHRSEVKTTSEGEVSTCCLCGQQILINLKGEEQIIKRGEINGVLTEIHPRVNQSGAAEPKRGEAPPTPAITPTIPPKPKKRMGMEKYWESNKGALLADYHSMLSRDFLLKWHLSSETWSHLVEKWNVVLKRGRNSKGVKVPGNMEASLPPLPVFSDSWHEVVQIEWLRIYKELRLAKKE